MARRVKPQKVAKPKEKEVKQSVTEFANQFIEKIGLEESFDRMQKAMAIMDHPIATLPPKSVQDSHAFGWMRGLALMTETMITGRWYEWLKIILKGEYDPETDHWPDLYLDPGGNRLVHGMMEDCMDAVYYHGYRVDQFLDWIGYGLGIAWFKKPSIPDTLWEKLYQKFRLDLFFVYPSDYFSHFLSFHGYSGVADYFPTPLHITEFIQRCLRGDDEPADLVRFMYEPCVGAGAMLLPARSLNLAGTDLNQAMVKTAAIHAFLYQPALLYTPTPIIGIHFSKEKMAMDRYFEFNTDTRLYWGDSILGELQAPAFIFEEHSQLIDIYFHPMDLEKREIFQYEEEMCRPWNELSNEMKMKIVRACSREFGIEVVVTNPPFNASIGKYTKQRMDEIESRNQLFLKAREERMATLRAAMVEKVIYEVQLKVAEVKRRGMVEDQLAFDFG